MKKKKYQSQLPLGYPPQIHSSDMFAWRELKELHKDWVVFILLDGVYVTMEENALLTHHLSGQNTHLDGIEICYFPISELHLVLTKLSLAGCYSAICVPINDPKQHLFT